MKRRRRRIALALASVLLLTPVMALADANINIDIGSATISGSSYTQDGGLTSTPYDGAAIVTSSTGTTANTVTIDTRHR